MWFRFNRKAFQLAVFLLFCLVIFHNIENSAAENNKDIPLTKFSFQAAPTVSFLYCYSCGYRKAFDEYSNILHDKYPELQIKGGNYDPPGLNTVFSRFISISKILFIIAIVSAFDFWGNFGMQPPSWWTWCTTNKVYAAMMVFFLGNMIEAQLISSGAFEISFNDVPIWSKLSTGRIPAPQELFQIIDSQISMMQDGSDSLKKNPDFVK
ncbi:thioredoxin reductase-like selenoprotein T homolog CG3887 [Culicoides brevitarsis]|uniref:thioredoxin reductase-like selenoprotein T homolog CG3887 n=1 Tax=Culicoides brevitarsis TaxID=469753 RepID=UPI00307B8931